GGAQVARGARTTTRGGDGGRARRPSPAPGAPPVYARCVRTPIGGESPATEGGRRRRRRRTARDVTRARADVEGRGSRRARAARHAPTRRGWPHPAACAPV